MTRSTYATLHAECQLLGTRLFTISTLDRAHDLARRAYTSHPAEYPSAGTKPMTRDSWFKDCIEDGNTFVANTPAGFQKVFFDHALITSMGLGSVINIPVADKSGLVVGTVNLLAEAGHFTDERIAAYQALVGASRPGLLAAMALG
jgi:hypothetical protein